MQVYATVSRTYPKTAYGLGDAGCACGVLCLSLLAACMLCGGCASTGQQATPSTTWPAPALAADREYLDLTPNTPAFRLEDMRADLVIVEVFDMYCRVCQKAARSAGSLYDLIEAGPYSDAIRMIGVGRGNSELEVDIYRKKYDLRFPLFADLNKTLSDGLCPSRIPEFIALKRNDDGVFVEVHRHIGYFSDAEEILDRILRKAKWQWEAK